MMNRNSLNLIILSLFFLLFTDGFGQSQPLFESDELLEFELTYSFKDFSRSKKLRGKIPATIIEISPKGDSIKTNLQISMRGRSRAKICRYPPIRLYFSNGAKQGVFVNQDKLKLVKHCKDYSYFEDYVKKEYLIYKLYTMISEVSVRARICKITYRDTKNPNKRYTNYGIILEDINKVAERNGLTSYKRNLRSQEVLNKDNLNKLVFFQYLIGNLDWEIGKQHNIKLLRGQNNSLPVAVPYDFDYSGFVDTNYAVPPKTINVPSVKTRVFRGFCRVDHYKATINYYVAMKDEFLKVIRNADYLSQEERANIKSYIMGFYRVLEDRDMRRNRITLACRAKHKHVYE